MHNQFVRKLFSKNKNPSESQKSITPTPGIEPGLPPNCALAVLLHDLRSKHLQEVERQGTLVPYARQGSVIATRPRRHK